ncbi:hypothetical protein B0H10DRAFT_2358591 [Mycena sp. CBHHK59/15]|nr:hypothetical protein B0H10DRAFT_2358591 [Mycena sp. CBHHK59/15]
MSKNGHESHPNQAIMCPDTASGVIVINALVTTCHNNNSCLEPGSIHPAMATRSFKPAYTDLREDRTPPHASVSIALATRPTARQPTVRRYFPSSNRNLTKREALLLPHSLTIAQLLEDHSEASMSSASAQCTFHENHAAQALRAHHANNEGLSAADLYVYRQSSFVILVIIMNSLQQTLWKPVPSTRAADYVRLPPSCASRGSIAALCESNGRFAVAEEDGRRGQRAEYFPDEFAYRNLKRRDYPHEKEFVRVYSINALTVNVAV